MTNTNAPLGLYPDATSQAVRAETARLNRVVDEAERRKALTVTTTELYAKLGDRSVELTRWDALEHTLKDAKVTGGNDLRPSLAVVYDRSDDDRDTIVMHPDEDRPLEAVERSIAALQMVRDALLKLGHEDFV